MMVTCKSDGERSSIMLVDEKWQAVAGNDGKK